MNFSKILPVVTSVLLNPYVIGAAVAVILYCNFVCYIVRYKKKPPQPKRKKIVEATPAPAPENADADGSNSQDAGTSAE